MAMEVPFSGLLDSVKRNRTKAWNELVSFAKLNQVLPDSEYWTLAKNCIKFIYTTILENSSNLTCKFNEEAVFVFDWLCILMSKAKKIEFAGLNVELLRLAHCMTFPLSQIMFKFVAAILSEKKALFDSESIQTLFILINVLLGRKSDGSLNFQLYLAASSPYAEIENVEVSFNCLTSKFIDSLNHIFTLGEVLSEFDISFLGDTLVSLLKTEEIKKDSKSIISIFRLINSLLNHFYSTFDLFFPRLMMFFLENIDFQMDVKNEFLVREVVDLFYWATKSSMIEIDDERLDLILKFCMDCLKRHFIRNSHRENDFISLLSYLNVQKDYKWKLLDIVSQFSFKKKENASDKEFGLLKVLFRKRKFGALVPVLDKEIKYLSKPTFEFCLGSFFCCRLGIMKIHLESWNSVYLSCHMEETCSIALAAMSTHIDLLDTYGTDLYRKIEADILQFLNNFAFKSAPKQLFYAGRILQRSLEIFNFSYEVYVLFLDRINVVFDKLKSTELSLCICCFLHGLTSFDSIGFARFYERSLFGFSLEPEPLIKSVEYLKQLPLYKQLFQQIIVTVEKFSSVASMFCKIFMENEVKQFNVTHDDAVEFDIFCHLFFSFSTSELNSKAITWKCIMKSSSFDGIIELYLANAMKAIKKSESEEDHQKLFFHVCCLLECLFHLSKAAPLHGDLRTDIASYFRSLIIGLKKTLRELLLVSLLSNGLSKILFSACFNETEISEFELKHQRNSSRSLKDELSNPLDLPHNDACILKKLKAVLCAWFNFLSRNDDVRRKIFIKLLHPAANQLFFAYSTKFIEKECRIILPRISASNAKLFLREWLEKNNLDDIPFFALQCCSMQEFISKYIPFLYAELIIVKRAPKTPLILQLEEKISKWSRDEKKSIEFASTNAECLNENYVLNIIQSCHSFDLFLLHFIKMLFALDEYLIPHLVLLVELMIKHLHRFSFPIKYLLYSANRLSTISLNQKLAIILRNADFMQDGYLDSIKISLNTWNDKLACLLLMKLKDSSQISHTFHTVACLAKHGTKVFHEFSIFYKHVDFVTGNFKSINGQTIQQLSCIDWIDEQLKLESLPILIGQFKDLDISPFFTSIDPFKCSVLVDIFMESRASLPMDSGKLANLLCNNGCFEKALYVYEASSLQKCHLLQSILYEIDNSDMFYAFPSKKAEFLNKRWKRDGGLYCSQFTSVETNTLISPYVMSLLSWDNNLFESILDRNSGYFDESDFKFYKSLSKELEEDCTELPQPLIDFVICGSNEKVTKRMEDLLQMLRLKGVHIKDSIMEELTKKLRKRNLLRLNNSHYSVIEDAKQFWNEREFEVSMEILRSSSSKDPRILLELGKCCMRLQSESPHSIMENYFMKSLNSNDRKVQSKAHYYFGTLAANNYTKLNNEIKESDPFKDKLRKELQRTSSNVSKQKEANRLSFNILAQITLEDHEKLQSESKRNLFLNLAVEHFLKFLSFNASLKKQKEVIFKVLLLWFENFSTPSVCELFKNLTLPPSKFVDAFYQIISKWTLKASDPDEKESQVVLAYLIEKLFISHPHLIIYELLAQSEACKKRKSFEDENPCQNLICKMKIKGFSVIIENAQLISQCYYELAMCEESAFQKLKLFKIKSLALPILTAEDESIEIKEFKYPPTLLNGINQPKLVECLGSNGKIYKQIVKGRDELRQDAIMIQVFHLINDIFNHEDKCKRRGLRMKTFKIIPFHPLAGVMEFIPNVQSLGKVIEGLHSKHFPSEFNSKQCRKIMTKEFELFEQGNRMEIFQSVILPNYSPALKYQFLTAYNISTWFEKREMFVKTMAVSSIVGYIIGLGDRHCENILFDTENSELIQIDLNMIFDQGKLLRVPELVPFRLTQNLVDAMGATKFDGTFKKTLELSLCLLKDNCETILSILNIFKYDPLYKWQLSPLKKQIIEAKLANFLQEMPITEEQQQKIFREGESELIVVKKKLSGEVDGVILNPIGQINALIEKATNIQALSSMYPGWQPWM